jgi:hypothetical protein
MTLRNENVSGGSGYASATIADLGFEPTDGATHTNGATGGRIRKKRATTNLSGKGSSGGALLTDQSADCNFTGTNHHRRCKSEHRYKHHLIRINHFHNHQEEVLSMELWQVLVLLVLAWLVLVWHGE